MRKSLIIDKERVDDLGDVVKIARKDGKCLLKCEKVRVLPEVRKVDGDLIVIVEEKK